MLTDLQFNTHIYQSEQNLGLIKKISVLVELNQYNSPQHLKEMKLDQLETEILQLINNYFPSSQVSINSLQIKYENPIASAN